MDAKELSTQALADFINWSKATVESTQGFLSTEIPLTLKEYITWIIVDNSITIAAWGILAIVTYLIYRASHKKYGAWKMSDPKENLGFWDSAEIESHQAAWLTSMALTVVVAATFFTIVIPSAKEIGQAVFAPRVLILEKVIELSK